MKVADLTVEELQALIRETIRDEIDPDAGMELTDELKSYLESHQEDTDTIPHEEVKQRFEKRKLVEKRTVPV